MVVGIAGVVGYMYRCFRCTLMFVLDLLVLYDGDKVGVCVGLGGCDWRLVLYVVDECVMGVLCVGGGG